MTLNFVESTKAIRPVSKALNDAIGGLPSGPFNFGLYFNKWMYIVSNGQDDGRKRGSPFSCSISDETKQKDGKKFDETWCRPNMLLDNLEVSLALFNGLSEYYREEPQEVKGKGKSVRVRCRLDAAWSRDTAAGLLSSKHNAIKDSGKAYEKLGYSLLTVRARLLSPLVVGLGNEHPTEKGVRFDWNMGVPYIPATGLKGVVRLAYLVNCLNDLDQEAAGNFWDRINKGLLEEDAQVMFGCGEDAKHGQEDRRGGILFFDAYPEELPRLAPEIMNCHYPEYLNKSGERGPTDDQQPNPQKYWAVSPWLDEKRPLHFIFRMLVPEEIANAPQYEKFCSALQGALYVHGLGAKTAVGHGLFGISKDNEGIEPGERNCTQAQDSIETSLEPSSKQPSVVPVRENWEKATLVFRPNDGTIVANSGQRKAETKNRELVPEDFRKKLFDKRKEIIATVEVERIGNAFRIVRIEKKQWK